MRKLGDEEWLLDYNMTFKIHAQQHMFNGQDEMGKPTSSR